MWWIRKINNIFGYYFVEMKKKNLFYLSISCLLINKTKSNKYHKYSIAMGLFCPNCNQANRQLDKFRKTENYFSFLVYSGRKSKSPINKNIDVWVHPTNSQMKWRCVLLYGESIDLRLIFGFAWTLKSSLVLLCGEVGPKPPQMLQLPWLMWHPSMRHFSFYCMYLHKEMLWCKLRTPNRSK